jgi:Domain of unknown function (DUF4123)
MFSEPIEQWREAWSTASAKDVTLRLFALLDSAQDERVVAMIASESAANECLFGYDLDSPIAKATPRLVSLRRTEASSLFTWLIRTMRDQPVGTLIASRLEMPALAMHFRRCIDAELEGLGSMFLALWDPAILATLVGQPDDETLHVPGPALRPEQVADLLAPLSHWWYFDREGRLHDVVSAERHEERHDRPAQRMELDAEQVDQLVEASVPDHLLQHIRQNQPELLERLPAAQHYQFARQQLCRAREHGLEGTGDLVNYLCLALAFGNIFDELPSMAALLAKVKTGLMRFDEALGKAPESELEARAQAPALL